MEPGDLVLYPGEGLDRRHRPLALGSAPLDQRAGVRQPGCQVLFGRHGRPAGRRMLPVLERPGSCRARLVPVEALPAQSQQVTRPRDGLKVGLLPGAGRLANLARCLIERPLPLVVPAGPLVSLSLPPVSLALPLVCLAVPLVSLRLPP